MTFYIVQMLSRDMTSKAFCRVRIWLKVNLSYRAHSASELTYS